MCVTRIPGIPEPGRLRWYDGRRLPLAMLAVAGGAVIAMAVAGEVAARRRARSVEVLQELGGVGFGPLSWPLKYILSSDRAERPVIGVDLRGGAVTDAGLAHLRGFSRLQWLFLSGTRVTDEGLAHLRGLSKLYHLDLSGTRVTDAGLAHLRDLSELVVLNLSSTRATDAGLAHMRGLSRLHWLFLSGTRVTDEGLVHLRGLSKLQSLELSSTRVTDEGAAALKKRLPNLFIAR